MANGLRAFGDLVSAEYGASTVYRGDEAMALTLEAVREARAVLAELMTLELDSRERTDLWMLQGSVLTAIDEVLRQLDYERPEPSTPPWLTRHGLPTLFSASPAANGLAPPEKD